MGDVDYFRRRLTEELKQAASSSAPVRKVHEELAQLYAGRLTELDADTGRLLPL